MGRSSCKRKMESIHYAPSFPILPAIKISFHVSILLSSRVLSVHCTNLMMVVFRTCTHTDVYEFWEERRISAEGSTAYIIKLPYFRDRSFSYSLPPYLHSSFRFIYYASILHCSLSAAFKSHRPPPPRSFFLIFRIV